MLAAQRAAAEPDMVVYFARAVGQDVRAHPGRYLLHVVALAAGPALGLGEAAEGLITAIHGLHTAAELNKETQ